MGILSWFRKSEPDLPSIDHPVFGRIDATIDVGERFFWETPDSLETPKGSIGLFFDASPFGPSDEQIALWKFIYENSERLTVEAEPLLRETLRGFGEEDQYTRLRWISAGLSPDGDRNGAWDISYQTEEVGAIYTVYFENQKPVCVSVDD